MATASLVQIAAGQVPALCDVAARAEESLNTCRSTAGPCRPACVSDLHQSCLALALPLSMSAAVQVSRDTGRSDGA